MITFPSCFNIPTIMVIREVRDQSVSVRLLLAALIRRAVFDIAMYKNARKLVNRRLAIKASQWMFDDRDVMDQPPLDRFTSFKNVCEILGQDPKILQSRALTLRAKDVRKFEFGGI